MLDFLMRSSLAGGLADRAGWEIAVKATLVLVVALAVSATVLRRRPFAQAAVFRACLIGLLLLPVVVLTVPRVPVPLLPAHETARKFLTQRTGLPPLAGEAFVPSPNPESDGLATGSLAPESSSPSPTIVQRAENSEAVRLTSAARSINGVTWIALGYAFGAVFFVVRLLIAWAAAERLRRHALFPVDATWSERLEFWRDRLQVHRHVQIFHSRATSVPVIVGWRCPMILLPADLAGDAGRKHVDSVLVHELCHVRRGDYLELLTLRTVQVLYWFHPLVWLLGREMAKARERVCDELCVHYLGGSKAYRATLLELASLLVSRPKITLGLAAVRSPRLERRLRGLEKTQGTARFALSFAVRGLILGGVLGSVGLLASLEITRRAAAEEPHGREAVEGSVPDSSKDPEPPATESRPSASAKQKLRVVEKETGEAIPNASIKIWALHDERELKTDARGEVAVELPVAVFRYGVLTEAWKDGFVGQYVNWAPAPDLSEIPEEQVYVLEKGSVISGAVEGKSGEPIAGARIDVFAYRESGERAAGVPVESDDEGRWRCTNVPESIGKVRFTLTHRDYVRTQIDTSQSGIEVPELRDGKAVLVMNDGFRIAGRVLDPEGMPVEGAEVLRLRKPADLGWNEGKTDPDGRFRFAVEKAGRLTLLVKTKDHAPLLKTVEVDEDLEPLSIRLNPGQTIEGQITDSSGQPLAGARIGVDEWRGQRGLYWGMLADEEGRFRWEGAPTDVVLAEVLHPGFATARRHPLLPGKDHVVALAPALEVQGQVVDAETNEPVSRFSVIQGFHSTNRDPIVWNESRRTSFTDGRYAVDFTFPHAAHFIKVEAEGYRPAHSRSFRTGEGKQIFDFRLEKDMGWRVLVRLPSGQPATGATVQVATPDHTIDTSRNPAEARADRERETLKTDANGSFSVPPQAGDFLVVFRHEQGFAEANRESLSQSEEVTLQPWGSVEGTARIGSKPAVGVEVQLTMIDALRERQRHVPSVGYRSVATTDEQGHYRFDRVPAGEAQIYLVRETEVPASVGTDTVRRFTQHRNVETRSGESTHVDLGGSGRPLVGRFSALVVDRTVAWPQAVCSIRLKQAVPYPDELKDASREERQRWYEAWEQSPAGMAHRAETRFFAFHADADGNFRVDDVPAGTYRLSVMMMDPKADDPRRKRLGTVSHEFTVPEIPGGRSDEPLDLGTLEATLLSRLQPGDPAPGFEVKTLEGERLALEDFRGRYVLLDFWATWCGPCLEETPYLKAAYAAHGEDDRFAMVGLCLDEDREAPSRYVTANTLAWPQGIVAEADRKTLLAAYGTAGIPQIVLIGPDGKIIANNLRGDQIPKTVEAALRSK